MKTLRFIFTDSGVLLLAVIVPLVYPLLYSWIYTNEVVREVPVCVIDESRSEASHRFIQRLDGTPDVEVAYMCGDMQEAQRLLAEQKAYGIVVFPRDFAANTARMEPSTISAYLDMSFLLHYKALYITLTNLTLDTNTGLQLQLTQNKTRQEDELQANSIKLEAHEMYNKTGGYGNFLLQAVIVIILQQTMALAMSMRAGWNRQKKSPPLTPPRRGEDCASVPKSAGTPSPAGEGWGGAFAFALVYLFNSAYVLLVTPKLFGFTQLIQLRDFFILVIPMLFAMLCFSMAVSTLFKKREDCMLAIVFTSLPLLFLVGISWPEAAIPDYWEAVAWLFPSTPAARAFVRLNEMGCPIQQVYPYLAALLAQGLFYMAICFLRLTAVKYRR